MYLSFCIFTFFKGKCRFDLEKKKKKVRRMRNFIIGFTLLCVL